MAVQSSEIWRSIFAGQRRSDMYPYEAIKTVWMYDPDESEVLDCHFYPLGEPRVTWNFNRMLIDKCLEKTERLPVSTKHFSGYREKTSSSDSVILQLYGEDHANHTAQTTEIKFSYYSLRSFLDQTYEITEAAIASDFDTYLQQLRNKE